MEELELSQKVRRKREIVEHGQASGWPKSEIQEKVRVEHANARRYIIEQYMPNGSVGAEVGVDWGDFATLVVEIAAPSKYYLIDPWNQNQRKPGNRIAVISEKLKQQISEGSVIIIQATGLAASPRIPNGSLDWAYIDCSHKRKDVIDNLNAYLPKVAVGGYLMVDDYDPYFRKAVAVADASDQFVKRNSDIVKVVHIDDEECQLVMQRLK